MYVQSHLLSFTLSPLLLPTLVSCCSFVRRDLINTTLVWHDHMPMVQTFGTKIAGDCPQTVFCGGEAGTKWRSSYAIRYVATYPTSLEAFLPLPFHFLFPSISSSLPSHLLFHLLVSLTIIRISAESPPSPLLYIPYYFLHTPPISSRLDLDKWINDPPSEGEEDNQPDGGDFSFLSAKGEFDEDSSSRKKKKGKRKKGAEDEDDLDQEELERVCMYAESNRKILFTGKYWFRVIDQ